MEGQQAFLMQMQAMHVKRMMATKPPRRSLEKKTGSVCRVLKWFCLTWPLVVREGCRGPEENIL